MCGRYVTGDMTWAEWRERLDFGGKPIELKLTWNLKPTQQAPIIRLSDDGGPEMVLARWWLVPRFFSKPLKEWKATTFNARIETAATAASFRASWNHRRCLVPAQGWYEWTGPKGNRTPNYFSVQTNEPGFCFAGLWDRAKPDGEVLESFTILTTEPNEVAAEYHSRMPVVLDASARDAWLNGETDDPVQVSADRLKIHAVAPLKDDGPELIEPVD